MKSQTIVATLLALGSSAAFAADQTLHFSAVAASGNANLSAAREFTAGFTGTPVLLDGGDDVLTFTGLAAGQYEFSLSLQSQNISWAASTLNGHGLNFSAPLGKNKIVFGFAEGSAAPQFELTLVGSALKSAAYSGTLTVTAVPEPETYALLLGGLGLMGFVARRRRV